MQLEPELELMPCPTCREVTLVEIPPCADEPCVDEHGGNCPDRACTVCGAALTVSGVTFSGPTLSGAAMGDVLIACSVPAPARAWAAA